MGPPCDPFRPLQATHDLPHTARCSSYLLPPLCLLPGGHCVRADPVERFQLPRWRHSSRGGI
eukprot:scaffold69334_cov27-Phaeocystis_antarctica.AAC.1